MTSERYAKYVIARIAQDEAMIATERKTLTTMIDKYNEAGITPTEIEADGFITRVGTLERINANKAKPVKECAYPKCEDCDKYHGHYCTVPMVITKQIYRLFEERLDILKKRVDELEWLVTDGILTPKKPLSNTHVETNFTWDDYLRGETK